MVQGLINDAKAAARSLIATYLARASVAVPFVAAAGFATAAITFLLVERFGAIAACWMVAVAFAAIGVIAALLVKKQEEAANAAANAAAEEESSAIEAVGQAVTQSPIELVSALLLSTPLGPRLLAAGVNSAARNLPILVLIILIGALLSAKDLGSGQPGPDGMDAARPEGVAWPADDSRPEAA
jgi:hypothetical protein